MTDHVNPDGKDLEGQDAPVRLVHVYAQLQYHDDCYIVGNLDGLRQLRKALDKAISAVEAKPQHEGQDPATHASANAEVMTADGEGYAIKVRLDDSDWQAEGWTRLALPYEDRESTGINAAVRNGAQFPFEREPEWIAYEARKAKAEADRRSEDEAQTQTSEA